MGSVTSLLQGRTDAELIEDKEYAAMGKTPAGRLKTLLGKMDSVRRSRKREFNPLKGTKETSNKFIGRVEDIFNNLLKEKIDA